MATLGDWDFMATLGDWDFMATLGDWGLHGYTGGLGLHGYTGGLGDFMATLEDWGTAWLRWRTGGLHGYTDSGDCGGRTGDSSSYVPIVIPVTFFVVNIDRFNYCGLYSNVLVLLRSSTVQGHICGLILCTRAASRDSPS